MSGIVDAELHQIAAVLGMRGRIGTYAFADAFRTGLRDCTVGGTIPIGLATSIEEAIVWRILLWRALSELGSTSLFEKRDKGAAGGTSAAHPALDVLAKLYERLKQSTTEIRQHDAESRDESTKGLPELMKPILEETEVAFDELLGPGGFPGRPSTKGMLRGEDSRE